MTRVSVCPERVPACPGRGVVPVCPRVPTPIGDTDTDTVAGTRSSQPQTGHATRTPAGAFRPGIGVMSSPRRPRDHVPESRTPAVRRFAGWVPTGNVGHAFSPTGSRAHDRTPNPHRRNADGPIRAEEGA